MKNTRTVKAIPAMNDDELGTFWETHEPEDFEGWEDGEIKFERPSGKLELRSDQGPISM